MSKQTKPSKPRSQKSFYSIHPWQSVHQKDGFALRAYVEASGEWETIMTIHSSSGCTAETMAEFVLNLINDNQRHQNILFEAMSALELCLQEDQMTVASEQAADRVITQIKRKIG